MSITRLADASPANVDAAAEVVLQAFNVRNFYVFRALYKDIPDDEADKLTLLTFKKRMYRAIVDHEVYVVHLPGDDRPAAAVIFKLPSDDRDPPDDEAETPYDAELSRIKPPESLARAKFHGQHMVDIKTRSWPDGNKRNYLVSYIGVAPWAQRKGLGKKLMRMIMERAKSEGREVSLSTHLEENVRYYEALGFEVNGYDEWSIDETPCRWWTMRTNFAKEAVNGSAA